MSATDPPLQSRRWSMPWHSVRQQVPRYRAAWEASNRATLARDDASWVVLGDSLSQGIGASAWDRGWVHRCLAGLRAADPTAPLGVVNLSRSGATTHDVLDRQLVELEQLEHTPAVVSLMIGANDMLRRTRRLGLEERIDAILPRLPPGTVLTYLPQPVERARRVNRAIDLAASLQDLRPVSIRSLALLSPHNSAADLFHPNDRGHQILADLVLPALLVAAGRRS